MKYIFSVFLIFLCGCSNSLYKFKEYDVRNVILEKPLVIPNNVYNFKYYNNSISNINQVDTIILHLLLNEESSCNKFTNYNIMLTSEDTKFLRLLNAETGYPNVRNEVNQESLSITSKNDNFINKVLDWQIDESLAAPCTEYKFLNNK